MAKKKNRRQTETCVIALKDLFLDEILTNKKLTTFYNSINTIISKQGDTNSSINISDEHLVNYYVEDFIHKKYFELIEIIEDLVINDPLKAIKKKFMNILLEMLIKKPEREEKLLEALINKLGDPEVEIVNHAIKLLNDLQTSHPKMSLVIMKNIQNFISKSKTTNLDNTSAQFYSLVYLCSMNIVSDKEFIEFSLNYFFDLFNYYAKLNEENNFKKNLKFKSKKLKKRNSKPNKAKDKGENPMSVEKILSLIVKRVNKLCLFSEEKNIQIKKFLDEKIDTLFKLSHSDSTKLRIEVLKLIFTICQGINSGKSKSNKSFESDNNLDRYYKSLYELILSKEIFVTKNLRDLLKLIVKSLTFDQNITRVAAFTKRLLQMSMHADASFITCVLIIISQIVRNRNKLWKMIEKNSFSQKLENKEENSKSADSDLNKRDPKFTNAEILPLSELTILASHYHPTVQKFSKFILENYNKDIIEYNGDPLIDFSLINFLEKFMLKNPKVKKEKKEKNRGNKEEEDLKKFMEEHDDEDEDDSNKKLSNPVVPDEYDNNFMQLDFISKFNQIEKTKSVKYEINKKKKEKKRLTSQDTDEFADKLIDEEYEKYDKDVDEDFDLGDEEIDGEDEGNDDNEDEGNEDNEDEMNEDDLEYDEE